MKKNYEEGIILHFCSITLNLKNKIFSPRLTCLETTGKIVPGIIRVNAMCIESESLTSDSAVLGDDVTLGFRIAEFINMYQVTVASPSLSFVIGQTCLYVCKVLFMN